MAHGLVLTDALKQAILARQTEPVTLAVERGAIRRFAEAIGDPNPLWTDEAQARRTRYGGVVAPPTFLRSAARPILPVPELDSLTRVLDGGSEWRYYEPVRPGDIITSVTRVVNLSQRNLSIGPAVFLVAETTYTNQSQQVVATQRSTLIRY
jgi:acyl dehydratase